jgi:hypothetical protein
LALCCGLAALLFPATAMAHGRNAPVATSFRARVDHLPAGSSLEAKVVDGDRKLWVRVPSGVMLTVLGFSRKPYIRFEPTGVYLNLHAPTYYLNRTRPLYAPAGTSASAPPEWKRVTPGHTYSWHENRLHALERLVNSGKARMVGRWSVPIEVGAQRSVIAGTLSYVPGLRGWVWPLAVIAAIGIALAAAALRRRYAEVALPVLALAAALVARLGRVLYGRPEVPAASLAVAALGCVLALALLWASFKAGGERRQLVALVIGGLALYQGLTLAPTLTKGVVLAALPANLERAAVATALACAVATLAVVVFDGFSSGLATRRWSCGALELGRRGLGFHGLVLLVPTVGHEVGRPTERGEAGHDGDREDQVEDQHSAHRSLP